jgi:predicted urease superfamily metal-dependent hydrolase
MNGRAVCFGMLALAGCASRALPNAELVRAEGAISAAAALGGGKHPGASRQIERAKKEIERAKTLARDGNGREGRLVLEGARVDAELGIMIMRAAKAREEAHQATETAGAVSRAP